MLKCMASLGGPTGEPYPSRRRRGRTCTKQLRMACRVACRACYAKNHWNPGCSWVLEWFVLALEMFHVTRCETVARPSRSLQRCCASCFLSDLGMRRLTKRGAIRISSHQRFCCQSSLKRKEVRKITPSGCPVKLLSWRGIKLRSYRSLEHYHNHNRKIPPHNEATPCNNRNAQLGSKTQIQWKQRFWEVQLVSWQLLNQKPFSKASYLLFRSRKHLSKCFWKFLLPSMPEKNCRKQKLRGASTYKELSNQSMPGVGW